MHTYMYTHTHTTQVDRSVLKGSVRCLNQRADLAIQRFLVLQYTLDDTVQG